MLGRIRAFVARYIVAEVPPELSACLDCGFPQCLDEKWESCPRRLADAAVLKRLDHATAAVPLASQGAHTGLNEPGTGATETRE